MHELSICNALLGEVERVARVQRAHRVVSVVVRIGPLCGVEPVSLERAYDIARAGTLAAGAELTIKSAPVRIRCRACGCDSEASSNSLTCARCGRWQVEVLSGEDLILESIELVKEVVDTQ